MAGGFESEGVSEMTHSESRDGEPTADKIDVASLTAFDEHDVFTLAPGTLSVPKYDGRWVISGSLYIEVKRRPSCWNRFWVKLLLGWEWEDKD